MAKTSELKSVLEALEKAVDKKSLKESSAGLLEAKVPQTWQDKLAKRRAYDAKRKAAGTVPEKKVDEPGDWFVMYQYLNGYGKSAWRWSGKYESKKYAMAVGNRALKGGKNSPYMEYASGRVIAVHGAANFVKKAKEIAGLNIELSYAENLEDKTNW